MTAGTRRKRRRRRLLTGLLIVAVGLGGLLGGAVVWLHQALPRIAADEIGRLMNARVETGPITLRPDGSVSIAGLVVRPIPGQTRYDDTILRAETISARFSRRSLLALAPRVTDISIENFLLDVQLNLDTGRWNIGTLRVNAPGGRGGSLPALRLQQGKLRYCKVTGGQPDVVTSIPVEGWFGREAEGDLDYHFEVKTSKLSGGYGVSRLSGRWRPCSILAGAGYAVPLPGELTVTGGLSSTDIPSLERAWAVDVLAGVLKYDREGKYTLELKMKDVHGKHVPEVDALRFLIPAGAGESGLLRSMQRFLDQYQPSGTVGSIAIQANGSLKKLSESEVEGKVVCRDISVCDREFPYRIDHLAGGLEFTQSTLRVNNLVGRHGEVEVGIEGWTRGFGSDRQYRYQITSGNMVLDQALYAALRPDQKRLWDTFHPTGTVSATYRLTRASPTEKRVSLTVDLKDVAAAFRGFPYPLAGMTGTVFFDLNSIVLSDVVARAGEGQIRVNGKVTEPAGGRPHYYVSIDARDVPLDAAVRDALPPQQRELYRCFDLRGLADVRARIFSTDDANDAGKVPSVTAADVNTAGPPPVPRVHFLAEVSCRQGSLKLPLPYLSATARPAAPEAAERNPFPEPGPLFVSEVAAQATITSNSLSIRKLEGRYGASPVGINGDMLFDEGDRLKLCRMKIAARQMPLNEATIALLPPALARQGAAFHAEGNVDLMVELEKADVNQPPEYTVSVNCLGDQIKHERFPYPWRDVRGTVTLEKDRIVVKDLTAVPAEGESKADGAVAGSAVLRIDGAVTWKPGESTQAPGSPQGSFSLKATDMVFSESLGRALPKTLAGLYRELAPAGRFDLDLPTVKVTGAPADETVVEVAGKVSPRPCRLEISGASTELSGGVETRGAYSIKQGLRSGRVRLAGGQLIVRGKVVTQTDIDATYDPNTQRWTAVNFTGDCYGGRLLGSLEIGRAAPRAVGSQTVASDSPAASRLEYQLQVALHNVDLHAFLQAGAKTDGGGESTGEKEPRSASATDSGTMDALLSLRAPIRTARADAAPAGAPGDGATPGGAAGRRGLCRIEIANMQVGKVSPLGNMLSVLRLSEPADYTFERMRIDSYVRGDKLLIPTFDVSGRNAALAGSGTMDLPTEEINLALTGRGRRVAAAAPSVFQSLTEGLGGAVVRIEVTGPAGHPRVQTKALPVLEDSLRILGTPEEDKKPTK